MKHVLKAISAALLIMLAGCATSEPTPGEFGEPLPPSIAKTGTASTNQ